MSVAVSLDIARMNDLIAKSVKLTGRRIESVVMGAAIWFIQSARKATPIARKGTKREIVKNWERLTTGGRKKLLNRADVREWAIEVLSQDGQGGTKTRYIPTSDKSDPRRKVPRVGAAKNSWNGMLRDLGKSGNMGPGSKAGEARKRVYPDAAAVTLINYLNYLNTIAPDVGRIAENKTVKRMEGSLDKAVGRQLKRLWA